VGKLTDMENDSWIFIEPSQARYGERSGLDFLVISSRPKTLYFTLLHKRSLIARLSQWVRHSELEFLRRRDCVEIVEIHVEKDVLEKAHLRVNISIHPTHVHPLPESSLS